jgi:hypothetical protein
MLSKQKMGNCSLRSVFAGSTNARLVRPFSSRALCGRKCMPLDSGSARGNDRRAKWPGMSVIS